MGLFRTFTKVCRELRDAIEVSGKNRGGMRRAAEGTRFSSDFGWQTWKIRVGENTKFVSIIWLSKKETWVVVQGRASG